METKKMKRMIALSIIVTILLVIGVSYAYFTARINTEGDNGSTTVEAAQLASANLKYGGTIEANGKLPGYKTVKTVNVQGAGKSSAKPIVAYLKLMPEVADFANHIKYSIYEVEGDNPIDANNICGESQDQSANNQYYDAMECDTSSLGNIIASGTFVDKKRVIQEIPIEYNTNKTYYIIVEYVNDLEKPQDNEQGKSFAIYLEASTEKEPLSDYVELGDYVSMVPDQDSYVISGEETGYESEQTIHPKELNLWRVINKNEDGTIELISEYVSSTQISFTGKTGYLNLVGALNKLASAYENPKYTSGSRHMGYDNQTNYLDSTQEGFVIVHPPVLESTIEEVAVSGACHSPGTHGNEYESLGGGDTLYKRDVNLVNNVLNTLKANQVGSETPVEYWLASRVYSYCEYVYNYWFGRTINATGDLAYEPGQVYCFEHTWINKTASLGLRPIVVLKAGVSVNGATNDTTGKSAENPWVLN